MKTIEIQLYKFDELKEDAQQEAIDNFINREREYFWMEDAINSLKKGLNFYGFEMGNRYSIDYSSANCSDADIRSGYNNEEEELQGVRLWKYLKNNFDTYYCKYSKKNEKTLGGNCPFTGYCVDENFLDPIREFIKEPKDITFFELMEECTHEVLKAMENDYDYQNSEEYAREELTENDYDFTQNGEIY
jgi:hypothetical protein